MAIYEVSGTIRAANIDNAAAEWAKLAKQYASTYDKEEDFCRVELDAASKPLVSVRLRLVDSKARDAVVAAIKAVEVTKDLSFDLTTHTCNHDKGGACTNVKAVMSADVLAAKTAPERVEV